MTLRTNKAQTVIEPFPGSDDNALYVHVTEHYEIIDPNLPYEKRFRTDHYTIDINDEDDTIDVSAYVSPHKMLELSRMFAQGAANAFAQMYVVKR